MYYYSTVLWVIGLVFLIRSLSISESFVHIRNVGCCLILCHLQGIISLHLSMALVFAPISRRRHSNSTPEVELK